MICKEYMRGGILLKPTLKSCIALFLCLALCLPLALPAGAAHTEPESSTNLGYNKYINGGRWYEPIRSHLVSNDDGTFTRVEYIGEKVVVETYSADFRFISGFSLDMELPLFGGFYSGETHNFLVFGQENDAEDDSVEVFRVVCYTKDWQRVGCDSLYGANTTIPFHGGSLRFAECDGYLYIRTSHVMYTAYDGRRHQANVMINFRIADTTIACSSWNITNNNHGYVSHSFNQFVLVDGNDLLAVDHGDAHPRAIALFRYNAPAGQDSFLEMDFINNLPVYVEKVNILPMIGDSGANDTGVALGGFAASDSAYLIAGITAAQEPGTILTVGQRNLFISVTSKEDFSEAGTQLLYLTDYAEGDMVTLSFPHLVKLSGNRFVILWTEQTNDSSVLRYCFVDGQGNVQGQIYTKPGALSDCVPVVAGDKLVWYVTSASGPAFCTLDLTAPDAITHEHVYTYDYISYPSYNYNGSLRAICAACGIEGPEVPVPAIKNQSVYTFSKYSGPITCTNGAFAYYCWNDAGKYGLPNYGFGIWNEALGHDWTEGDCETPRTCLRCNETGTAPGHQYDQGVITREPTCDQEGVRLYHCTECGESYEEAIEKRFHLYMEWIYPPTCEEDGYSEYICQNCNHTEPGENFPALGHNYLGEQIPPTQTEGGYDIYTCLNCGDSYVENETPPLGTVLSGTITSFLTQDAVTVELLRDGQVIQSQILSGMNCDYSFRVTERGAYTLRVRKASHVTMEFAVSTEDETAALDVKICPVGDITGDGVVNAKDYQRLLRHINKTNLLSEEQKAFADLNGDGVVNAKDYQRLLRHINKTNPLF